MSINFHLKKKKPPKQAKNEGQKPQIKVNVEILSNIKEELLFHRGNCYAWIDFPI